MNAVNAARRKRRNQRRAIERQRVFANAEAPHWSARGRRQLAEERTQAGMDWTPEMYTEVKRRNAEPWPLWKRNG